MEVYHGSFMEVAVPEIEKYSRSNLDFGKGFYTTPIREQAASWARRLRRRKGSSVINLYEFKYKEAIRQLKAKTFDSYSDEWLLFILDCRNGKDTSDYDIVIGGVANDKVFNTVELFFDGLIDKSEALRRLKYEQPNQQICIRNQEGINRFLKFKGSENI